MWKRYVYKLDIKRFVQETSQSKLSVSKQKSGVGDVNQGLDKFPWTRGEELERAYDHVSRWRRKHNACTRLWNHRGLTSAIDSIELKSISPSRAKQPLVDLTQSSFNLIHLVFCGTSSSACRSARKTAFVHSHFDLYITSDRICLHECRSDNIGSFRKQSVSVRSLSLIMYWFCCCRSSRDIWIILIPIERFNNAIWKIITALKCT